MKSSNIINTIVPECVDRNGSGKEFHCAKLEHIVYCALNYLPKEQRNSPIGRSIAQECGEWRKRNSNVINLDWRVSNSLKNIVDDTSRRVAAGRDLLALVDQLEASRKSGDETPDILKAENTPAPVFVTTPRDIGEILPECVNGERDYLVEGSCQALRKAKYCATNYYPPSARDNPTARVLEQECRHWWERTEPESEYKRVRAGAILNHVNIITQDLPRRVAAATEIVAGLEHAELERATQLGAPRRFRWFGFGASRS